MKRKLLVVLLACAMLSSCGVKNVGNTGVKTSGENGIHIKNGDSMEKILKVMIIWEMRLKNMLNGTLRIGLKQN